MISCIDNLIDKWIKNNKEKPNFIQNAHSIVDAILVKGLFP